MPAVPAASERFRAVSKTAGLRHAEIAVATRLPATIRYPEVIGQGRAVVCGHPLSYTLTRRLGGRQLDLCWETLTEAQRRGAITELGRMLRELHRWRLPDDAAEILRHRPDLRLGTIAGIVGSDVTPLPVERTLLLTSYAEGLPYVDSALITDTRQALQALRTVAPVMDDPARHGLIHGDPHLSNLWWSQRETLVLLDLEWVRFGPPELDLQRLCDRADEDVSHGSNTHPDVLRWLADAYPELFSAPDLLARLRLYSLSFAIRELILNPPDRPAGLLPADHTLHRLRRIIDGDWPAPGAPPVP